MPIRKSPGDGGGGGSSSEVSVPSAGIAFEGPIEIVVGAGVMITPYSEQRRISFTLGFPDEVQGDILYRGADGWKRLAAGSAGQKLTTNGPGADPTWT